MRQLRFDDSKVNEVISISLSVSTSSHWRLNLLRSDLCLSLVVCWMLWEICLQKVRDLQVFSAILSVTRLVMQRKSMKLSPVCYLVTHCQHLTDHIFSLSKEASRRVSSFSSYTPAFFQNNKESLKEVNHWHTHTLLQEFSCCWSMWFTKNISFRWHSWRSSTAEVKTDHTKRHVVHF